MCENPQLGEIENTFDQQEIESSRDVTFSLKTNTILIVDKRSLM